MLTAVHLDRIHRFREVMRLAAKHPHFVLRVLQMQQQGFTAEQIEQDAAVQHEYGIIGIDDFLIFAGILAAINAVIEFAKNIREFWKDHVV